MKNESKSAGGIARALKLTPEQRKEIARKAATERWKGKPGVPRQSIPRKIKGIPNKRYLTAVISLSDCKIDLIENGNVIHSFIEQSIEEAKACMKGYLAALQDLGIEVILTEENKNKKV